MKGKYWGKKEDGTYGFTLPPKNNISVAEQAQKIIDNIAKERARIRPNFDPNYVPPQEDKPKRLEPAPDPYFAETDPCWLALVQVINAEIRILERKNNNPRLNIEATSLLRGGIKELEKLLKLPERRSRGQEEHLKFI